MIDYNQEFNEALQVLNGNKLLNHILLIGSWADYLYEKCDVLKGYKSTIRTYDLDFLIKNINQPRKSVSIIDIMESNGFGADLSRNGIVCFRKGRFEVEFLARSVGPKTDTVKAPSYGLEVETFTHIGMLIEHAIQVNYEGIYIQIPSPQAMALHKMIISGQRHPDKVEKDRLAIDTLIDHFEQHLEGLEDLKVVFETLTKKEKKKVRKYINDEILDLHL